MLQLKYSHPQIDALKSLLISSHNLHIKVRILDLDHGYREDLSDVFVDGQVNFDADAEVTRSCDITVFDPLQAVQLDPDSPSPMGVFITNMVSIMYVVTDPTRTLVYEIPVFCGPVEKVDRDGLYLNIKCLGKESLSLGNLWHGRTYRKGQEKTQIIKSILRTLCGETKLDIPDLAKKAPNGVDLTRTTIPWKMAKKLAGSIGYQLFYDGRGVARMRKAPFDKAHTFKMKNLSTVPKISYDLSQTINAVEVTGRKPKKSKTRVSDRAVAPRAHTLSPWNIGRGNPKVPRYLWKSIQDDDIRTNAEAREVAEAELRNGLLAGISVTFDGPPNPLLEELDLCTLDTDYAAADFRCRKWTLPLVAGENASYGYIRRITPTGGKSAVRRKKG